MAIVRVQISIIILNVNELNSPIKSHTVAEQIPKKKERNKT